MTASRPTSEPRPVGQARCIAANPAPALRPARLEAQLLTRRPATSPEAVVDQLLAVQAQDARAARLSIRSRSAVASAAEVDAALTQRRTLVVGSLQRTTLHLVAAADYWWLHALLTPRQRTSNATRLRQEGVTEAQADRGVAVVHDAVLDGPRTRAQLRAVLDRAGVPTAGQALPHVLHAAAMAGHVVRGPVVDGEQAFVAARSWLGDPPEEDRAVQLARLAERYLRGHGPAAPEDLAKWTGLALGECRRAFTTIADRTEPWGDGLVRLAAGHETADADELPAPRLLGGFDPILHGWASRSIFVPTDDGVVTNNGIFRPTALVRGRVVATWRLAANRLTLLPLAPIPRAELAALEEDAAAVGRYLDVAPLAFAVAG